MLWTIYYGRCRKKLEEAARYWVNGGVVDERVVSLEAFGATPEQIAAAKAEVVEDHFEVWEVNWEIVMMFIRLSTQWTVSMSGLTGLNYSSLEYLCKLYGVKDERVLFEGIQIMEMSALSCMNKKK